MHALETITIQVALKAPNSRADVATKNELPATHNANTRMPEPITTRRKDGADIET